MPPSQVPPSCPILGLEWLGARCLLMSPFVLQRGEGSAWEPLHHGRDWSPDKGLSPQRAVDWENLQQPSGAGKPSEIRSFSERKDDAAVVAPGITGSRGPKRLLYRRAQMDKGVTAMEDVGC
ncbi:uncharacterized protein LOC114582354 isoform X1 [Podarcis muralis]